MSLRRTATRSLTGRLAPANPGSDASLLPLINLVFLILIFLMMAAVLVTPAPFDVEAPRSEAGIRDDPSAHRVALSGTGELALAGERLSKEVLVERLGQAPAPATGGQGVLIEADARLDARQVLALVTRLEAEGFGPVRLKLEPAGD
ncbi:hypothetical protein GJ672_06455 [Spiribacter sp. 2438]|uniref:ExbD/TolR family protein n=1 Tax=Spiribacter sp. 2438 TaxID=2666185 RepID=UPI0012B05481|nr:biopolymer transporter ExbD [Spiribacter sp. 2438]QGM21936.1 hypothetical protein GJ672_06455 [Spiribacter sp. 2438]